MPQPIMMKNLSKNIIFSYLIFSLVYFVLAYVFFEPARTNTANIIAAILASLSEVLYWINAIGLYLISILLSAIIGMIIMRNNRKGFVLFRGFAIGSAIALIIGVVASYF